MNFLKLKGPAREGREKMKSIKIGKTVLDHSSAWQTNFWTTEIKRAGDWLVNIDKGVWDSWGGVSWYGRVRADSPNPGNTYTPFIGGTSMGDPEMVAALYKVQRGLCKQGYSSESLRFGSTKIPNVFFTRKGEFREYEDGELVKETPTFLHERRDYYDHDEDGVEVAGEFCPYGGKKGKKRYVCWDRSMFEGIQHFAGCYQSLKDSSLGFVHSQDSESIMTLVDLLDSMRIPASQLEILLKVEGYIREDKADIPPFEEFIPKRDVMYC
ncbi:MAG: hypothetical protein HGB34_00150 [Candidatus Moranbacteria bacterium]|nr:hypothetical protein [Candidatus Moranbacteria bacterium]